MQMHNKNLNSLYRRFIVVGLLLMLAAIVMIIKIQYTMRPIHTLHELAEVPSGHKVLVEGRIRPQGLSNCIFFVEGDPCLITYWTQPYNFPWIYVEIVNPAMIINLIDGEVQVSGDYKLVGSHDKYNVILRNMSSVSFGLFYSDPVTLVGVVQHDRSLRAELVASNKQGLGTSMCKEHQLIPVKALLMLGGILLLTGILAYDPMHKRSTPRA
jgi:hypothetical protein